MQKYLFSSESGAYTDFHSLQDWHPQRDCTFVICIDKDHKWEEPAYWNNFKFYITRGFLKGKELPFVAHWRYMTEEEFDRLLKSDPAQE